MLFVAHFMRKKSFFFRWTSLGQQIGFNKETYCQHEKTYSGCEANRILIVSWCLPIAENIFCSKPIFVFDSKRWTVWKCGCKNNNKNSSNSIRSEFAEMFAPQVVKKSKQHILINVKMDKRCQPLKSIFSSKISKRERRTLEHITIWIL